MKRKLVSILLSIAMVVTMMPVMTSVASAETVAGRGTASDPWQIGMGSMASEVKAYMSGGTLVITGRGSTNHLKESEIPWASKKDTILQARIDEGIMDVPDFAFSGCSKLTRVTIASSVRTIGMRAFADCTNLMSIELPKNLIRINHDAFEGCTSLRSISVDSGNSNYTYSGGVVYSKDMTTLVLYPLGKTDSTFTLPSSVTSIEARAFSDNQNLTKLVIPKTTGSLNIGIGAFASCRNLTTIQIETKAIPTLSTAAFSGCNIKELIVPSEMKDAYKTASGWKDYSSKLPKTGVAGDRIFTDSEGNSASTDSTGKSFAFTVTGSGEVSFALLDASVYVPKRLVIPDGIGYEDKIYRVTSFAANALAQKEDIEEISITNNITSISASVFEGCRDLARVTINGSNPNYVSVDGVLFTKDMKTLVYYPPAKNSTTLTLPTSVTKIESNAFKGNRYLKELVLPVGLGNLEIGSGAFTSCTALTTITINTTTVPTLGSNAFSGCTALKSINVPSGMSDTYRTTTGWSSYASMLSKDVIVGNKFYTSEYGGAPARSSSGKFFEFTITDADKLEVSVGCVTGSTSVSSSLTLPSTISFDGIGYKVTSIAANGFAYNSSVRSVTVPDSITRINYSAFDGCTNLTSVSLSSGITSIPTNTFRDCEKLVRITIPWKVASIGASAFQNCKTLTTIDIPESVTGIGKFAFQGCTGLTSVTINASEPPLDEAPYMAFDDCNPALKIYVASGTRNDYVSDSSWDDYEDIIYEMTGKGTTPSTQETTQQQQQTQQDDSLRAEQERLKQEDERLKKEAERLKQEEERLKKEEERLKEEAEKLKKEQEKEKTEEEKEKQSQEQEAKLSKTEVKKIVNDMQLVTRTADHARGIMVHVLDVEGVDVIEDAGYEVVYDFYSAQQVNVPTNGRYRLTKVYGKSEAWYLNTAAGRGKRYYYKAVIRVLDAKGNVVAKTSLTQAKYGYRTRR